MYSTFAFIYFPFLIQHCTVERVPQPQDGERFVFNISVKGGKTHVFASSSNDDLSTWLNKVQVRDRERKRERERRILLSSEIKNKNGSLHFTNYFCI